MWVIDDKSWSLLVNTGDLEYMGEPSIIVTASSILDAGRGAVFKYLFDGGKKLSLAESFEIAQNRTFFVCFMATEDSTFISALPTDCSKVQKCSCK